MQAADGMAYLHSSKPTILHRDLRCANIFINNHDVVKVVCTFLVIYFKIYCYFWTKVYIAFENLINDLAFYYNFC